MGHEALVRLSEVLDAGGPIVAVLLVMSVVALAIVLLKLAQFRAVRIGERRFVAEALTLTRRRDVASALRVLSESRNPIARAMDVAIRGRSSAALGKATVREEVQRVAAEAVAGLRTYLRGLEVIATLSPLLGLLGTVLGMIEVFQAMEAAGAQTTPSILAGGIWEALLTTAVGLGVAIPVVAATNWLESAIETLTTDMESAVTRVFTHATASSEDDIGFAAYAEPRFAG